MADSYIEELLIDCSSSLLENVSSLECKGIFKMFLQNLFTCIKVRNEYSTIATQLLSPYGFQESPLTEKANSPGTHISIINGFEQRRVSRERAYQVQRKWKNSEVTFQIEKVEMWVHRGKNTEDLKLLCCLKLKSATIDAIRADLGWRPYSIHYNMHMNVSEKYLE